MCKHQKIFTKLNVEVMNMSKNQMLKIDMLKYQKRIPIRYLRMTKFKTLVLHDDSIPGFKNLQVLKLIDILFPTSQTC